MGKYGFVQKNCGRATEKIIAARELRDILHADSIHVEGAPAGFRSCGRAFALGLPTEGVRKAGRVSIRAAR
jgi:hypothetical protein